jgi:hypothetical protein
LTTVDFIFDFDIFGLEFKLVVTDGNGPRVVKTLALDLNLNENNLKRIKKKI